MRELVKRLEVLEGQQFTRDAVDVILVELVSPGLAPQELRTLTHDGVSGRRVWERFDGETEAKFKARVCREVTRGRDCVPVLLSGFRSGRTPPDACDVVQKFESRHYIGTLLEAQE